MPDLAGLYMRYLEQMSREFGIENRVTTMDLARLPEVLSMEQEERRRGRTVAAVEQTLRSAAEHFRSSAAARASSSGRIFCRSFPAWRRMSLRSRHTSEVVQNLPGEAGRQDPRASGFRKCR